jgi:hypothetical protein
MLFQMTGADPTVLVLSAVALALVALCASLHPRAPGITSGFDDGVEIRIACRESGFGRRFTPAALETLTCLSVIVSHVDCARHLRAGVTDCLANRSVTGLKAVAALTPIVGSAAP